MTVNDVVTVVDVLLKKAIEMGGDRTTARDKFGYCAFRMLQIYDFDEYDQLVTEAKGMDRNAHLVVLLAREAALRCDELMALEWGYVDLGKSSSVSAVRLEGPITDTEGDDCCKCLSRGDSPTSRSTPARKSGVVSTQQSVLRALLKHYSGSDS